MYSTEQIILASILLKPLSKFETIAVKCYCMVYLAIIRDNFSKHKSKIIGKMKYTRNTRPVCSRIFKIDLSFVFNIKAHLIYRHIYKLSE